MAFPFKKRVLMEWKESSSELRVNGVEKKFDTKISHVGEEPDSFKTILTITYYSIYTF